MTPDARTGARLAIGELVRGLASDLRAKMEVRAMHAPETLLARCPTCEAWPDWVCCEGGRPCAPHPARVAEGPRVVAARRAAEDEEARAAVRARLEAADVPARHITTLCTGQLDEHEPLQAVRRWHAAPGRPLLVLVGARGIGKSLAAAWAVAQGPRRGGRALWVQATELAAMEFYGEAGQRLEAVRRCGLLVVDEVGAGEVGRPESWGPRIESVLCSRHDRDLDTLVTSNMSKEEFVRSHDERVLDRLRPGSGGTLYSCNALTSARSGRGAR